MKLTLNLASRRYVNRRALNQGLGMALVILVLFCGWGVYGVLEEHAALQQSQLQVSEQKAQLDRLRGGPKKPLSAAERAKIEAEFTAASALLAQDAFRWTSLLDRMEKLLPVGVGLESFRPDFSKNSLALSGRARSLKNMRTFLDQLMKEGDFEQVVLKNHGRVKVKDYAGEDRDAISFTITLQGVF